MGGRGKGGEGVELIDICNRIETKSDEYGRLLLLHNDSLYDPLVSYLRVLSSTGKSVDDPVVQLMTHMYTSPLASDASMAFVASYFPVIVFICKTRNALPFLDLLSAVHHKYRSSLPSSSSSTTSSSSSSSSPSTRAPSLSSSPSRLNNSNNNYNNSWDASNDVDEVMLSANESDALHCALFDLFVSKHIPMMGLSAIASFVSLMQEVVERETISISEPLLVLITIAVIKVAAMITTNNSITPAVKKEIKDDADQLVQKIEAKALVDVYPSVLLITTAVVNRSSS